MRSRSHEVALSASQLPPLVARALYICAGMSLVATLVPAFGSPNYALLLTILIQCGLPVGVSLLFVAVDCAVAVAAMRRKRIAVVVAVLFEAVTLASNVFAVTQDRGSPFWVDILGLCVSSVLLVTLLLSARQFPGRITPGRWILALTTLLGGLALVFGLGIALGALVMDADTANLARWSLARLIGQDLLISDPDSASFVVGTHWLGFLLSLLAAAVFVASLYVFVQRRVAVHQTLGQQLSVRRLISQFPSDSLGYFATRGDRLVVFSPERRAAVSYSVSSGSAVAAGEPLGDPANWDAAIIAWLDHCLRQGLAPGVLSTTEAGARAFKRAGFTLHQMGDEAVIDVASFDERTLPELVQTSRRVRRSGTQISVERLANLTTPQLEELRCAAEGFRVGAERGFTMSLERILSPEDPRTLIVTARRDGRLEALLSFVPWGRGLSLSLMRRGPQSVNGVVQAMVVELVRYGKERGIDRISLNFAMFRQAFVEGRAVDATLPKRLVLAVMKLGSRFWQLESLYESNAKYAPNWLPRYMGYLNRSQSALVLLGSARLEGFVPELSRRQVSRPFATNPEYLAQVAALESPSAGELLARTKLSPQRVARLAAASALESAGMDVFPPGPTEPTDSFAAVEAAAVDTRLALKGRVASVRDHGGVVFADLFDGQRYAQVAFERTVAARFDLVRYLRPLDVVLVRGSAAAARGGTPTLWVDQWSVLAKALREPNLPLPGRGTASARRDQRTAALLTHPERRDLLRARSQAVRAVREYLWDAGYDEVETPILQPIKGGANARPFTTHLNATGADMFLRIAPELYLKRLAVAGMGAIFEMGRSFRNEGADATHNPEFTSLEAYRAGRDYRYMIQLTQDLTRAAAKAALGTTQLKRAGRSVDLGKEWPVVPVLEAVSQAVGQSVNTRTQPSELAGMLRECGIEPQSTDAGYLITQLYDELVEPSTFEPTFYTDFPTTTSPLTRQSRHNPLLAERWDLVAFGMEIGTAYTELTDPRVQRERFTAQSLAAAGGDAEAMSMDEPFLSDLELGLVPTAGLGLGIDRLVMMLTGTDIRGTLAFPLS